jgi:DNA-directed RNA polymerase specialized sigma subunit
MMKKKYEGRGRKKKLTWDNMTTEERVRYITQDQVQRNGKILAFSDITKDGGCDTIDLDCLTEEAVSELWDVASYYSCNAHFECLTKRQNKCVNYVYFDGLSVPEIAKRLKLTNRSVYRELRSAKDILMSHFCDK